jgi:hypothetical protein
MTYYQADKLLAWCELAPDLATLDAAGQRMRQAQTIARRRGHHSLQRICDVRRVILAARTARALRLDGAIHQALWYELATRDGAYQAFR